MAKKHKGRSQADWERLDTDRRERAIELLLQHEEGRYFLRALLTECGVLETPRGVDEASTNFLLGKHAIGIALVDLISQVNISAYPALLLEGAQENVDREVFETTQQPDLDDEDDGT